MACSFDFRARNRMSYSYKLTHETRCTLLQSTRLLDHVRERARHPHYSLSTEKVYLYWVRFFIRWHGLRHLRDMSAPEVQALLFRLANSNAA